MPADRTTDRSDLGLIQTGSGTKPPSRQRPTFHSMDTHAPQSFPLLIGILTVTTGNSPQLDASGDRCSQLWATNPSLLPSDRRKHLLCSAFTLSFIPHQISLDYSRFPQSLAIGIQGMS